MGPSKGLVLIPRVLGREVTLEVVSAFKPSSSLSSFPHPFLAKRSWVSDSASLDLSFLVGEGVSTEVWLVVGGHLCPDCSPCTHQDATPAPQLTQGLREQRRGDEEPFLPAWEDPERGPEPTQEKGAGGRQPDRVRWREGIWAQEPRTRLQWGRLWGSWGLYLGQSCSPGRPAWDRPAFCIPGLECSPSPSWSVAALTGQRHLRSSDFVLMRQQSLI